MNDSPVSRNARPSVAFQCGSRSGDHGIGVDDVHKTLVRLFQPPVNGTLRVGLKVLPRGRAQVRLLAGSVPVGFHGAEHHLPRVRVVPDHLELRELPLRGGADESERDVGIGYAKSAHALHERHIP